MTPQETTDSCARCRFWVESEPGYGAECRRRAPVAMLKAYRNGMGDPGQMVVTRWPHTDSDHWCGEHEPKAHEAIIADCWCDHDGCEELATVALPPPRNGVWCMAHEPRRER